MWNWLFSGCLSRERICGSHLEWFSDSSTKSPNHGFVGQLGAIRMSLQGWDSNFWITLGRNAMGGGGGGGRRS